MTTSAVHRDSLGQLIKIGQGGHGVVYQAPDFEIDTHDGVAVTSVVFKEYRAQVRGDIDFAAVSAMAAIADSLRDRETKRLLSLAAWPLEVVHDSRGPCGFVMPSIPDRFFTTLTTVRGASRVAAEFQHLLNERHVLEARDIEIDDAVRYALLRETASALAFLHGIGVCVGDVSPKNMLFSLAPREAVFFVDCDAMRINGVSAVPQAETPGWEVPAGESLATVSSDTYKLGLLALRLIVGSQDTGSVDRIPAATPKMLRQIIIDTLSNEPDRRPRPEAWSYVLGHAVEEAQNRPRPRTSKSPVAKPESATPKTKARAPSIPTPTSRPAASKSPTAPNKSSGSVSGKEVALGVGLGIGIAVIIIGLIFAVVGGFGGGGSDSAKTTRTTTTTRAFQATPTTTAAATVPTTTPPVALSTPPRIVAGPDMNGDDRCINGAVVADNRRAAPGRYDTTTCQFALNVGRVYWELFPQTSNASRRIVAPGSVSCTTVQGAECSGRDFYMTCQIRPGDRWVTCTGGRDAIVYLF